MRHLSIFALVAFSGCTLGEAAGLYDVPEETPVALADAPYPRLLTLDEIAARGISPLSGDAQADQIAAATALKARADAITQEEATRLQARAGTLRQTAEGLPIATPGLSAGGRALLARAGTLRRTDAGRSAASSALSASARALLARAARLRNRAS